MLGCSRLVAVPAHSARERNCLSPACRRVPAHASKRTDWPRRMRRRCAARRRRCSSAPAAAATAVAASASASASAASGSCLEQPERPSTLTARSGPVKRMVRGTAEQVRSSRPCGKRRTQGRISRGSECATAETSGVETAHRRMAHSHAAMIFRACALRPALPSRWP
eukprot:5072217-Pleurochrysis_carterae.AAC.1